MKITKHEHACLVIEEQGKKLVIDPGSFVRTKFDDLTDVVGIVITHVHMDHMNGDHISDLLKNNPNIPIYGTQEVAGELKQAKVSVVTGGSKASVPPFNLQFFGEKHAAVHSSLPVNQNVGVLVNDSFYYPGDSFTVPEGVNVQALAIPTSAPWLKLGEVMDFLGAVKPKTVFPTHNALNSELGESLVDQRLTDYAKSVNVAYQYLAVGESIEI